MNYEKIRTQPNRFESLTSLRVEEFDLLLVEFERQLIKEQRKHNSRGTARLNKVAVDKQLPTAAHALFFITTYLKLNPLQEQHGASFDMSQAKVSRLVRTTLSALSSALEQMGHMPCRNGADFAAFSEQRRSEGKEEHFFLDASERDIQRPDNDEDQEDYFSGKKKAHKVKNTVVSNEQTEILYLGYTTEGKCHDKKMVEEEELSFPDDSFVWKDLGFLGFLPKNVICFELHKKPKNGELTAEQKAENAIISSIRIVVEHAIGGLKRCRIVKDTIRLYEYFLRDRVVAVCAAIHNFRISKRPPYQVNAALDFCPI